MVSPVQHMSKRKASKIKKQGNKSESTAKNGGFYHNNFYFWTYVQKEGEINDYINQIK